MNKLIIIAMLTLPGCAHQIYAKHINDPAFQRAYAECNLQSMHVHQSNNSGDNAFYRGAYRAECLKLRGYNQWEK